MNRRSFFRNLSAGLFLGRYASARQRQSGLSTQTLFFGTAGGGSKGIYRARFDAATGHLSTPELIAAAESPSFLARSIAFHPDLYAVTGGDAGNAMAATYAITGTDASVLDSLGAPDAGGAGGCHISVHPDNGSVFVANYTAGSVASFHAGPGGRLHRASYLAFPPDGHGPVADRQAASHAHCALPSPDGGFVLVNDLGLDCIHILDLDRATSTLKPHGAWKGKAGSGPRHIAVHPNGRWIYNINELNSTIDLLDWSAGKGTLTTHSTVSTLTGPATGKAGACEVILSPDLRFLYASNRVVQDSFAVFAIDPVSGELSLLQIAPNRSKHSRHIAIDPSGQWLLSANQFGDTITVLPRDSRSGKLGEQAASVALGAPTCLLFA